MNLMQSTLLNVINIPHFRRNEEVNECVKLLLSCYHGGYLWLNRCIIVDLTLINWITGLSMQGPNPQDFYPGKTVDHALSENKGYLRRCREGPARLQGSLYPKQRSAPCLSVDRRQDSS
jgi:hypothetical protein